MYPLDFLLPLALSNFLPLALTYGFVVDPGTPGAGPKCKIASLDLGPLNKTTFSPFGLFKANWSKVVQKPPALVILALAVSVNLKAHTLTLGTSKSLTSSVIVPTKAKIGSAPLNF